MTRKHFNAALCVVTLQLGCVAAFAQQTPDPTPPPLGAASFKPTPDIDKRPLSAQSFVTRAAATDIAEIELGELALARSANPQVKAFAVRMITDHKANGEKLKAVAAAQKIALPATMDEAHSKLKQQLATLDGKTFDVPYLQAMASGHDEAVALYEAAAKDQKLPSALREFASQTLPTITKHRDAAHGMHK